MNPATSHPSEASNLNLMLAFIYRHRWPLAGVAAISGVLNLLALTGSLYMLQVYDRVLTSRSLPTLVSLTVVMIGAYAAFGVLDLLRGRAVSGLAVRLDRELRDKVFSAVLMIPLRDGRAGATVKPVQNLDQIRSFLTGAGPIALLDLPWLPIFLIFVFLLHPLLGIAATLGALVLVGFAVLTELRSRGPAEASSKTAVSRQALVETASRNAEVVQALGLGGRMTARWHDRNEELLASQRRAMGVTSGLGAASRVFRLVLQSALLGLGAYVVILGEATAGVMIAALIITSRAPAPIEGAIANWRGFILARQGFARLSEQMAMLPPKDRPLPLPRPKNAILVADLFVAPPGLKRPVLRI